MADDETPRPGDEVSAEKLEQAWEHALQTEHNALEASAAARTLHPSDIQAGQKQIREERSWLSGIGATMRRLVPTRRSRKGA
jgi:hypothetical protein